MDQNDPRVGENLAEMASAFVRAGDPGLVEDFLRCLLTPAEVADVAGRWALVKALDKKITQREVSKMLGLSLCKITRGSRELKKPGSAFRRVIEMLKADGTLADAGPAGAAPRA